jgi:hypothetical protein
MIDLKKSIDKEASRTEGMIGYYPNIANPSSYSEKVLWRKFFDHNPLLTTTADKVLVKEFLVEKFGDQFKKYITPTIYSTTNPKDIPFEDLTYPCIIKANNGSGTNIIVESLADVDRELIYSKCNKWLKKTYGQKKFEWAYVNIKPKILIEPLINANDKILYDYRFFVFNGKISIICIDRGLKDKMRNIYDENFKKLDLTIKYPNYNFEFDEPKNFDEMKDIARKIGSLFDFVRVDLYNVDGNIYFGETTHYPGSGAQKFNPKEFDFDLGTKWILNV